MINRGLPKKSQYFLNSTTGRLEKKENNVKTIESLNKQKKKKNNKNIEDVQSQANNDLKKTINSITVITAEDNLIHNYFFDFDHSWDATNCLSTATIKMPKMGTENVNYWATYQGAVTVYGGHDFTFDKVNSNSHATEQEAANSLAQYNDNSDIKPFFKGTISRIKEYQTYIVLHLDSIGIRFKQKIPDDFRQSYINNQNVRDAFQAICEFLGVQYICPPQKINEAKTESEMLGGVSTDGTENDVTQQQNTEQKIMNKAVSKAQEAFASLNNNNNNQENTQNNDEINQALTNNQEIDVQINGYDDINFDANGAITHNSATIETSPDMAQILIDMEENPLERYLEDETGVVEKVQKFLDGDMFEEIHNSIMDYGAITIQPSSTTTTDITLNSTNDTGTSNTNASSDNSSSNSSSSSSSGSSSGSSNKGTSKTGTKNGWIGGQYYINGKIYLSNEYINSLTPSQAWAKYVKGKDTYTDGTLNKLRARGYWQPII